MEKINNIHSDWTEEDYLWDDEDHDEEDDDIIGYVCIGCGHTQEYNDDDRCDRCYGMSLEPIYF